MRILFLSLVLLLYNGLTIQSQTTVNEEKSSISFVFTDDEVDGIISGFEFDGTIDLADLNSMVLKGSVVMETLDTDNWLRDRHLRSRKYFNNREHPLLYFESKSIIKNSGGFTVQGNLSIKGVERDVTWQFNTTAGGITGTTSINTSDFDINIHKEADRNKVDISINLVFN